MAAFQKIVLTIFLVILVIALIVIGVMLYYNRENTLWPPETSECPDYWDVTGPGLCKANPNLGNIGNGCDTANFRNVMATGEKARKSKCTWAKKCGVYWDGITNANLC